MSVLTPQVNADNTITIADDLGRTVCTVAELRDAVATWGTYYGELSAPTLTLEYSLQCDCLNSNPPVKSEGASKEDREYWWSGVARRFWSYAKRHAVYDFVEANNLFPIARTTPSIDVDAVTAAWRAEIPIADQEAALAAMRGLDALLANTDLAREEARLGLCEAVQAACPSNVMVRPFCAWIWRWSAMHGICSPDKREACRPCCFYSQCWSNAGQQNLYRQLVAAILGCKPVVECEALRDAIVAAQAARDALIDSVMGTA